MEETREARFGAPTKGRKFPPEILTPAEVRSIMAECSRRGACGARDRALIAVLFRAGLRVNEALLLEPKDIDLASGEVRVLHAKGGKTRTVAVDDETVALIELWLERRGKALAKHAGRAATLFCTLAGKRMSRVQLTQRLKELATAAGIEKRVHPHGFRHSRAVDLVKNGAPLPVIQAAYGHSSLQTTQTYVSHLAPQEVVDAMRKGAW